MSEQFFTDERMFIAAAFTWSAMFCIGAVLVVWRDWDAIWIGGFLLIQTMLVFYYYLIWQSIDSPITLFPAVNMLARPGFVSLWALILSYALVRLYQKWSWRKQHDG